MQSSCPCHCGGKAFRWAEGASLAVCFRTMTGVRELIHLATLAPSQKQLLHVFLHHARDKHACWPGGLRLLESTGLRSRQTLSTHKKALRALGILDWLRPGEEGNTHASALYRLNWSALQELVEQRVVPPPCSSSWPRETTPLPVAELPPPEPSLAHEPSSLEPPAPPELSDEEARPLALPDEAPPAEVAAEVVVGDGPPSEAIAAEVQQSPSEPEPVVAKESFEVPAKLVWLLWREAYEQAYRRVYLAALADQQAVRAIARSCSQAVSHHEKTLKLDPCPENRTALAQQFLRHIFASFLRRPGRNDFLRERAHPLHLLPADLNALGVPWGVSLAPTLGNSPPKPEPLPAQENQKRIRDLLSALHKDRPKSRPEIKRSSA